MMNRAWTVVVGAGLATVLALSSCTEPGAGSESSDPSSDQSSSPSAGATADGSGIYQDTVETRRADLGSVALEEVLKTALDSDSGMAFDVTIHRVGNTIENDVSDQGNDLVLSIASDGEGVAYKIEVARAALGGEPAESLRSQRWVPLRGKFEVESDSTGDEAPTYVLTKTGDVDPIPRRGRELCQKEDIKDQVADAEAQFQDASIDTYRSLKNQWADAPLVWGAIKNDLKADGGEQGGLLSDVCSPHWE